MSSGISPLTSSSVTCRCRVAEQGDLLHRQPPDPAQLDREADDFDVQRDAFVVAQPDQHRRDRADQRDGALAEDAIGIVLRRSPSWLASSSRIASALPVENGLKVWLSFSRRRP